MSKDPFEYDIFFLYFFNLCITFNCLHIITWIKNEWKNMPGKWKNQQQECEWANISCQECYKSRMDEKISNQNRQGIKIKKEMKKEGISAWNTKEINRLHNIC